MHRSLLKERVGSAEIVKVILLDHFASLLSQVVRGMSIREPLFNRLVEVIGGELFYFQPAGGEQRQERADGERACMRGIAELLIAVLIGSPLSIFAHHQVFNR